MRKAACFLFLLLTGYVAGMYASPALMVLTAAQILLTAGMAAQPRYFLRHLTFSAPEGVVAAEQGEVCQVRLSVKNDGHMPVGRFRLEILREATGEEEEFPRLLSRAVPLVSPEDAARMQEDAMRCRYGADMPEEKEQEFLYGIYLKTARKLLETMGGWRRFRFRFLKAFG